jgi:DNA polymerase-3 subunit gamma/tau
MPREKLEPDSSATTGAPSEPIHTKYRPRKLSAVVGQKAIVKSIEAALKSKARPHAYLFSGGAGTGKTTLARIIAAECGCDAMNLIEVDAASESGVDDVRSLTSSLRYNGFGANPSKAVIIDECHRLSKNAWDALLKITEEPPPHVFFFFCTTDPGKVPKAIVTRCSAYSLAALKRDDIIDVLEDVCDKERYETNERIIDLIADSCEGSMRGALTMLAKVHDCDDIKEAAELLQSALESPEIFELCKLLCWGRPNWGEVVGLLGAIEDAQPESIRIMVTTYVSAVLLKPKNKQDVPRLLDVLGAFSKPCNPTDKMGPILLACGKLLYD